MTPVLAVFLLLLASAIVCSDPTWENLLKAYKEEISAWKTNQSTSSDESRAASMNGRQSISIKDLSAAGRLLPDAEPGWTDTTFSTRTPTCPTAATEVILMTAALGSALLIHCPLSSSITNFKSVAWTHTPTGWTISRRVDEQVAPSPTRRLYFAKDGTSLVVAAVRETDAFQCTLFVSSSECRSALISIDAQRCQSPKMNPCANGGDCSIVLPSTPAAAVDCLCVYGYRGSRCEDEIGRGLWLIVVFWIFIVLEVTLIFAGAYRFLQLRRTTTESIEDQDVPVFELLSLAPLGEKSVAP